MPKLKEVPGHFLHAMPADSDFLTFLFSFSHPACVLFVLSLVPIAIYALVLISWTVDYVVEDFILDERVCLVEMIFGDPAHPSTDTIVMDIYECYRNIFATPEATCPKCTDFSSDDVSSATCPTSYSDDKLA